MRGILIIIACFMMFSIPAKALVCERIKFSATGFHTTKGAEGWFPKQIRRDDSLFKPNPGNPDQMVYRYEGWTRGNEAYYKLLHFLNSDGNLILVMPKISGYKSTGSAHYTCNKTSLEMKELLGIR